MIKILVIQGPNLNMLGQRESEIYGNETLENVHQRLQQEANAMKVDIAFYQSNAEAELIEKIHRAIHEEVHAVIINPAAFTHTSVALRDALLTVDRPFIEVHLSNIYQRESFRHHSYFSDKALAVISGLGTFGYVVALQYLVKHCQA